MKKIIYTSKKYTTRDSRNEFISIFFSKYLQKSVVNIGGGGEKYLLKYIHPSSYLEIDIAGKPILKLILIKIFQFRLQMVALLVWFVLMY